MPCAILDENVSLEVAKKLIARGYEVIAIAHHGQGMSDEAVFDRVIKDSCLLLTRDTHFTNPVRFPPEKTGGILYITEGNLRGYEEANLVEQFLSTHDPATFAGQLAFLSPTTVSIR